jgi:threonine/homoserine/homoserine lactone efflux protein
VRTIESSRRGSLVGAWVILGHAALEAGLIVVLMLGLARLLRSVAAVRVIGVTGGLFLAYMGVSLLLRLLRGSSEGAPGPVDGPAKGQIKPRNPVLGGVLVSMSNPYWWIWWATIGFAFMIRYEASLENWPALVAFFLGHEAGDLAWYLTVSVLVSLGRRKITGRVYRFVLAGCAVLLAGFGVYLGASSFFYVTA